MRILGLSSFVPEQICDVIKFDGYQGDKNISHYCGYVSDYISQINDDDTIDGAVYPKSCDSTRVITSYLENMDKFFYQIHVPARQDDCAIEFFAESIKLYKKAIEDFYKITISEKDIFNRCKIIESRNQKIKILYNDLNNIKYSSYLNLLHNLQKLPLSEQMSYLKTNDIEKNNVKGKSVFLIGSRITNMSIIEIIEKSGMNICGDNITESKRLFSQSSIKNKDDLYLEISKSILENRLSPTQNNFEDIISKDIMEIKDRKIEGVIFLTQKYCEPYDYLYAVYKKALDEIDIPVLRLSVSGTSNSDNNKLSLEAFSEMI